MSSLRNSVTYSQSASLLPREDFTRDRLQKIEQKLQTITLQRSNQAKEDAQELITKRILQLQTRATEEMKCMEQKLHGLKDQFCSLKMRDNQINKKYQLCRRNRQIEIQELQKKVLAAVSFENKVVDLAIQERKDKQKIMVNNLQDKTNSIACLLSETQKKRIADLNQFDQNLVTELPATDLAIQNSCGTVENKLEELHRKVMSQTKELKENIEDEEENREVNFKKVMEMVSSVVDQIKKDLEAERQAHQENKERLLVLFSSASEKLNSYQ